MTHPVDINSNSNTANSNYAYSNEDNVNSIVMGEQNNLNDNSIVIHEQINLNNNSIVMHEDINQNDSNQSNTYQSISIAPDSPPARESISTDVGQSRRIKTEVLMNNPDLQEPMLKWQNLLPLLTGLMANPVRIITQKILCKSLQLGK